MTAHPAQELRDRAMQLGPGPEAMRLLEMAFSLAFMENVALPFACKIGDVNLASPAHALLRIAKGGIVVAFMQGVEKTPALGLKMFPLFARLFAACAANLAAGEARQIVVNFSDGCETEGDYRRVSFSCSKPDTILVPDYHFANSNGYAELRRQGSKPWRQRQDRLFWRGTSSGRLLPGRSGRWDWHQRVHLCHLAQISRHSARLDIGMADHDAILDPARKQQIEAQGFLRPRVPMEIFRNYRYLVDVDGFSNSWLLLEKLTMGATLLKIGSGFGYRQWYYGRLEPWVHYIPVAPDLSDFEDRLDWMFAHEEECERIAANGAALAAELTWDGEFQDAVDRLSTALG